MAISSKGLVLTRMSFCSSIIHMRTDAAPFPILRAFCKTGTRARVILDIINKKAGLLIVPSLYDMKGNIRDYYSRSSRHKVKLTLNGLKRQKENVVCPLFFRGLSPIFQSQAFTHQDTKSHGTFFSPVSGKNSATLQDISNILNFKLR